MLRALAVAGLFLWLSACQAAMSESPSAPSATVLAGEGSTGPQGNLGPATVVPTPSFPSDRVATRVVVPALAIDLPVMLQTASFGSFPLCDVALYQPELGQPGEGRATYIYAHARQGMFLPLLTASLVDNGQSLIGDIVKVYTSDSYLFTYRIVEVDRHALTLDDAFAAHTEELFLQTSEGPHGTVPKLQVIAAFVSASTTDPNSAHPVAHPRTCA